jgi:hypothetical protein
VSVNERYGAALATTEPHAVHAYKVDWSRASARPDGAPVCATHIETEQQLLHARDAGCAFGQGFYFARPQPADVTSALVHHPFRWSPTSPLTGTVPAGPRYLRLCLSRRG